MTTQRRSVPGEEGGLWLPVLLIAVGLATTGWVVWTLGGAL